MALADLVVVMNNGRIEQAGPPRERVRQPATEFVARFLGGHNVIETPRGPGRRARRPGRCVGRQRRRRERRPRSRRPSAPSNTRARTIRLRWTSRAIADLTALVSDEQFAGEPLSVGDSVSVRWADRTSTRSAPRRERFQEQREPIEGESNVDERARRPRASPAAPC